MPVHEEVLRAALRICRRRGNWRFRTGEILKALPHLNPRTIRTHIVSRCCINAPANHPHRWEYFERVARGEYSIRPPYRKMQKRTLRVAESPPAYQAASSQTPRDTIHVVVIRSRGWFVAECLEVTVVTQGKTMDELMENLREAIDLHFEGENPNEFGITDTPRVTVTFDLPPPSVSPSQ